MSDIYHPEAILDVRPGGQYGIFFVDNQALEAGFETIEEAQDHVVDLVDRGQIYYYEAKIVRLNIDIEEIA